MKYKPCPWCSKLFESEKELVKHIRSPKGHGKKICSNCKEPLSRCKDITGSGASFACKRKRGKR